MTSEEIETVHTGIHEHKFCAMCLTRQQRRAYERMQRQRKYACCAVDPRTGARDHSRGKHNHSRYPGAMDHSTGTNFWVNDPSATIAVKHRMTNMEWYLVNVDPPFYGSPERPFKGLTPG